MTGPEQRLDSETGERFVRAIADHVPPARVAELYLFPPMRSGPLETGVAVVTVTEDADARGLTASAGATPADGTPSVAQDTASDAEIPRGADAPSAAGVAGRHVVYTATYRHTRKGPDRGAWSIEVVAQADAPLDAVAAAVRGVHRRTGDADTADAARMTGEEFRSLLDTLSSASGTGAQSAGPAPLADGEAAGEEGRDRSASSGESPTAAAGEDDTA